MTFIFCITLIFTQLFSRLIVEDINPFFILYDDWKRTKRVFIVIHFLILIILNIIMKLVIGHTSFSSAVCHLLWIVCYGPMTLDWWIAFNHGLYDGFEFR
uniref:Uncharacterized protein n=1 Tax=Caenorhabditis tropicalis TaxID=1561998 RepID=A0A1I7UZ05_9PELO